MLTIKNKEQIHKDIKDNFADKTMIEMSEGSVIDLYTLATSKALEDTYTEINRNRNPHIFTRLEGQELDDTGVMVNCPREPNEDDKSYMYRIMNWTLSNEMGNETSINNKLMNLEHASSAQYIPFTEGVGTASVYIIPKKYEDEEIDRALEEVDSKISEVISESTHVTLIIPEPKLVDIVAYADMVGADTDRIHSRLHEKLKKSINEIPPNDYLNIGEIQRSVIMDEGINYFNVLEVYVDGEVQDIATIFQSIEEKLLLNELSLIEQ